MKYFETYSTNPYYNLAFEEYVHKNVRDDDCLILWQNHNTIVYGAHQNPLEEINLEAAKKLGVSLVRRNTGGGTVYHDLGNLNFSYITDWNDGKSSDYAKFLQPVIHAFKKLELDITLKGRNDLLLDGRKISGSAQHLYKDRILHHGTLLINSNLEMLQRVLNVSQDKITSKGIKSVRSRVTNIANHLPDGTDISMVKNCLIQEWALSDSFDHIYLDNAALAAIRELEEKKYRTWEWNYSRSPRFDYKCRRRFSGGEVEINLDIKEGIIQNCMINGDFLCLQPVSFLEQALINVRYNEDAVSEILSSQPLSLLFGSITQEELMSCFFI